ncbi:acyl-CoA dehydrogenase family protein [Acidiferrimicrobium sp. IK]|uniref:acyl-CoA dehydrogenase family protein n=1 Tax=Acidiferrimicrobium sp. IK TaxID=2871700 RepID=UPI0021CAF8FE|nr:acyl-CoA dehydrogenase family protein [Acidiferrimicrobium sp. IK]MCU4183483.1 acyl-CoA dehydrogenase family protein [Acidiferrimicrobium sp. IK]
MSAAAGYGSTAEYMAALSGWLAVDERIQGYRGYRPASLEESASRLKGLQAVLADEGWSRLGWPERCGGLGGDPRFRGAMFDTLWEHDIPVPEPFNTLEILAPVMLVHAPHLAQRYFYSLLRGDEAWAQAFSEPDAGSDLASLRTRMEPDGDGFRLTGQKVWSSFAHLAQRSVLLARSGGPGHRGLTMVLIDLDQPGIDVRPIRSEDGENHFSEIFLDGAHVPGDRVIGELGQGWAIAMYMLQWERGAYGWLQQGRFHSRLEHALRLGGDNPGSAAMLGHAYAMATALRLHTKATVDRLAEEEVLGPEVSIDKLLLVDAELATWDAIRHHLGPAFDLDERFGWLRTEYFFSRAAPIYGGSQEIQRTLVAQRVLGMPREK